MTRRTTVAMIAALSLLPSLLWAQAKVGTAGVQFLKISPSCRAIGMGEAFVAVGNDASSIFHNPAALARFEYPEATVSYIDYAVGLQYAYLGAVHPMTKWKGAWAASVIYLGTDDMEETTPDRPNGTGRTFTAGDMAVGISYAQQLTNKFSVGGTVKVINETLADKSASGWAADVGTYYNTGWKSVRIAMLTSNFGPDMNFVDNPFPLPMNFTFGVSGYVWNKGMKRYWTGTDSVGSHALLASVAWSHPNDNIEVYNFGFEYGYENAAFLRFGKKLNGWTRKGWDDYQRKIDADEDATGENPFYEYPLFSKTGTFFGNGASAGAGVKFNKIGLSIDYAFSGISYLENIHRFSIGYKLDHLIF